MPERSACRHLASRDIDRSLLSTVNRQTARQDPPPAEAPALSPRRRRAGETRAKLFYAACELFLAHGYQGTTVDRIAAHAGVAKGTFFVHFKTKDAVITQLVEHQTHAARRAREEAIASKTSPLDALAATVLALGEQAGASKTLSRAVLAATLESGDLGGDTELLFGSVFESMVSDARAAKRRGLLAKGVDPRQLAWSLMASYLGAALYFTSTPRSPALLESLTPLVEATLANAQRKAGKPPARKGKREKAK